MEASTYKPGEALAHAASLVGRPATAYGPKGTVHAGIVVAAAYVGEEIVADVAIVSYGPPDRGRLVSEARLIVQGGLALTADTDPKPHTFSLAR